MVGSPLMGVVLQEEASLTGMVLQEEDSLTGMVLGEEALAHLEVATVLREEEDILEEAVVAAVMIQTTLHMEMAEIAPRARLRATTSHWPAIYGLP